MTLFSPLCGCTSKFVRLCAPADDWPFSVRPNAGDRLAWPEALIASQCKTAILRFVPFQDTRLGTVVQICPQRGARDPGPYSEHVHIKLSGVFLSPERMRGRRATIPLIGDRREQPELAQPVNSNWKPLAIGSLELRGDYTDYYGSVPYDALWGLMNMLACRALGYVSFHGEPLRRGKAGMWSLSFGRQPDPDEFEGVDLTVPG